VLLAELDADTLQVRIGGYCVSHDSGRLINPTIVEGQIQGAVALGLGSALFEEIRYDAAGPAAGRHLYGVRAAAQRRRAADADRSPRDPLAAEPLGLKGVGESGTLPVRRGGGLGGRGRASPSAGSASSRCRSRRRAVPAGASGARVA